MRWLVVSACARASAPIHGAEAFVPEESVKNADGSARLRAVADVGVESVAAIAQVLDGNSVPAIHRDRQRRIEAGDVIVPAAGSGADATHEILAPGEVE